MYLPTHYVETRIAELHRTIVEHPLGILVTNGSTGLDANHLPFELAPADGPHGTLRAHVARASPMWQTVETGAGVLAIFRGNEAYISPNSYPSKHETHRQVPTWNYVVVHAHGRITIRDDEPYVRALVARLTRRYEAQQPVPWKMSDSPKPFIDEMLGQIVGIEIEIARLIGKSKLSQNKDERDRRGAADALESAGETELAQEMLAANPYTG